MKNRYSLSPVLSSLLDSTVFPIENVFLFSVSSSYLLSKKEDFNTFVVNDTVDLNVTLLLKMFCIRKISLRRTSEHIDQHFNKSTKV